MFKNVKAQIERQNDLIARAESLVNKAESEKRELTPDEAQELAEIRDDVKKIKEYLDIANDIDSARVSNNSSNSSEGGESADARACEDDKAREEAETRAFENFLRETIVHERAGEMEKGNNGAIIPKTIAKKIISLVYDICPILEKSEKFNVKGTLEVPYYPADSSTQISVAYADEFEDLTSSTGNFGAVELTGYLAGALTKISRSLINNVDFDIVAYVVSRMAYDIARFEEKELLIGTTSPTAKVKGMSEATTITTTTSATAISGDDLIDLQGSVKDVFQPNAMWIMSPKTRDAIRKLTDDVGRYLLQDDISAPFGKTLLGKPVYVTDNMPDISAGTKVIYYGDFSGISTKFSEELNIQVLREVFATQHAVGVVGWLEFDGRVTNQQKLAVLQMHSA